MNFIDVISATSKIAISSLITAFFIVVYETYLYIAEIRKNKKPVLPQFNPGDVSIKTTSNYTSIIKPKSFLSRQVFVFIAAIFIFASALFILEILSSKHKQSEISTSVAPTISQTKIIASGGIKLYDKNWNELYGDNLRLKNADVIIIAIKTIKGVAIDRARIRVNSSTWNSGDETDLFNIEKELFYRNYTLGPDETNLTIEAQLHSREKGWLE